MYVCKSLFHPTTFLACPFCPRKLLTLLIIIVVVVVVVVVHYFNLRGTRKKKDIQTIKINVMIYNRKALATTK